MRMWLGALLLLITQSVIVRDARLLELYRHGEMARLVIDREEHGIITKWHFTQMPSTGDAGLILVWMAGHVGVICTGACCLSRRNRIARDTVALESSSIDQPASEMFREGNTGMTFYWLAFAACQVTGFVSVAFAGISLTTAPAIVSMIILMPGSLVAKPWGLQLLEAIAVNFAWWFAMWKWRTNSPEPEL